MSDEESTSPLVAVVGIGASAGGLEALEGFFVHLPANSRAAFVVVTHQHAGRTSLLPDLLRKHVSMPVMEATNGMAIEPDHVYLAQPGCNLAILNGVLQVMDMPHVGKVTMPIDFFFRTLALDQKSKAVGIVLSGTGSDGSLGLKAIQGEGGLTMVQNPGSAKYSGMPTSAIATRRIDFVLPVEQLAVQLLSYLKGPSPANVEQADDPESTLWAALQTIFILLRDRTRHDFSCYKKSTLRRRIERRMSVHQIAEYPHYARFLQENPNGQDALFKELLIGVTSFFRDTEAFAALASDALPALLASKGDDDTVRAWVPGCSTGEEAYSIAMCLLSSREQLGRRFRVQVFATDLDSEAVEFARKGIYPEGIADNVGNADLERYFVHKDACFQIKKDVRESVVFAVHNILSDPPFHGLDLVSCRNLLIYLENEPQERLLAIFHYALQSGGVLLLGSSESVGSAESLFVPIDKKWKIFKRTDVAQLPTALARTSIGWTTRAGQEMSSLTGPGKSKGSADIVALLDHVLLERHVPPSAIIHESGEILAIHGRTGAFLEPSAGKPSMNILTMAREGLRAELILAIRQALSQDEEVLRQGVRVRSNGDYTVVDLLVQRLQQPNPLRGMLLVTIRPVRREELSSTTDEISGPPPATGREEQLERELRETKAILQNTIERLETTNEELTSTNEELQSTNEESQSVNEELETTKEEMQSLNEELQTVNSELEAKVSELSRANDDIVNLLNATEIGTLFLDATFRITRFTLPTKKVVNVIASDVGRPISDISSNLERSGLLEGCQEVLETLVPKEVEVRTKDGAWYLMRTAIYRTTENVIGGVVITFADISRLKIMIYEKALADEILTMIREPVLILESSLRVAQANNAFLRMFQVSASEVVGRSVYELSNGQWDSPQLRALLEKILPANSSFEGFRVDHAFPRIGQRSLLLNARRVEQGEGQRPLVFLAFQDITSPP